MNNPVCLICGKAIDFVGWDNDAGDEFDGEKYDQVNKAGNVEIRFYYGSRHDMCFGAPAPLGHTGPYRAYICDDCFEKEEIQQRLKKDEL